MQVANVIGPREIRLDEAPIPTPGRGEVLVRIRAVGLCGSDLQYYAQGRIGDQTLSCGHILGHEVAGVVEALGPEADGPPPGTPVVVDPAMPCGRCRFCLGGDPNLCRSLRFFGSPPTPGALREYIAHPSRLLLPLPPGISYPVGAAIEPLGVAIHAVDLGHIALGDRVAVFGCGPIGLLVARMAQLAGAAQVSAVEPLAHRRQAALRFGASVALDPAQGDVVKEILDRTDGEGVDVAFEVAGSREATRQTVEAVRPGGTIVLIGYWKTEDVTLPGIRAMRKGLTIRFVRRMKHTFPRAMNLVGRGVVDLQALITHEFNLPDVAEGFIRAERRGPDVIKAVIRL
ncbi:MAG TPA: alcohol dehydrogenase catalytic domain-containing protein [Candidatus Methylomirabilis sp.]|nr:alcohol dehydrogenase catalytic domain-containing protein [Candidatus Methylomirabilis sp.]